ncbi:MAG TPA: DUF3024 domain-containing protein [Polyangiaceae bacterium]|nr:DUF3024 domain-containing protein [Polyangiaceae bacterium]
MVKAFIESRRPPPHLRSQVDLAFRVAGQSVEIFEVRPHWKQPEIVLEHPVAKATYVKTTSTWRVFWHRSDLKWHRYGPVPEVRSLEDFIQLVAEDAHACFWG